MSELDSFIHYKSSYFIWKIFVMSIEAFVILLSNIIVNKRKKSGKIHEQKRNFRLDDV